MSNEATKYRAETSPHMAAVAYQGEILHALRGGPKTAAEIGEAVGGSPFTVRSAIERMLASGLLAAAR